MGSQGDILEGLKLIHDSKKVVSTDDEEVDTTVSVAADKKELGILLKLTDALRKEHDTSQYTMTVDQRRVVDTLTNGYHTRAKMEEGYNATLKDGFFNVSFNDKADAPRFMLSLETVLGKKGCFEFRRVALNNGNKVQVPGWGHGVTGVIYETRLFKVK